VIEERVSFVSEGLRLEGRLAYADDAAVPDAKVLICPPHPFLGGDMDNNVLACLAETLTARDFVVFRFNYRGIGSSETDRDLQQDQQAFWDHSTCPGYEARIMRDSRIALQTLQEVIAVHCPIMVIGYSFGCLPALDLVQDNAISKLVLISPPLTQWQFEAGSLQNLTPKKVFFSTDDFACPEAEVSRLYDRMAAPKQLQAFTDADHFFIGQEQELASAVSDFLRMDEVARA
jgi:hypothetical protein